MIFPGLHSPNIWIIGHSPTFNQSPSNNLASDRNTAWQLTPDAHFLPDMNFPQIFWGGLMNCPNCGKSLGHSLLLRHILLGKNEVEVHFLKTAAGFAKPTFSGKEYPSWCHRAHLQSVTGRFNPERTSRTSLPSDQKVSSMCPINSFPQ